MIIRIRGLLLLLMTLLIMIPISLLIFIPVGLIIAFGSWVVNGSVSNLEINFLFIECKYTFILFKRSIKMFILGKE